MDLIMENGSIVAIEAFKVCTKCNMKWTDRETFLQDPQVVLTGYQVNFQALKSGYFLFNHMECKTTLSLKAELFIDMYTGPMFSERLTGTKECSEYCLYENNVMPCPEKCECAYVRQIIDLINKKGNPKTLNP